MPKASCLEINNQRFYPRLCMLGFGICLFFNGKIKFGPLELGIPNNKVETVLRLEQNVG